MIPFVYRNAFECGVHTIDGTVYSNSVVCASWFFKNGKEANETCSVPRFGKRNGVGDILPSRVW